jgi:hypothetical protein
MPAQIGVFEHAPAHVAIAVRAATWSMVLNGSMETTSGEFMS